MAFALFGSLVFLGVLLMFEATFSVGVHPLIIGAAGLAACYMRENRGVARQQRKYDQDILRAYTTTHCTDGRRLEISDDGYTLTCKCGTVRRLWTGLVSFSENTSLFVLVAKTDSQIIPKSSFSTDGMVTEFRALVSEKLNVDRAFTARYVEYTQTPVDVRAGWKLHFLQGGGWRRLVRPAIILGAAFCVWAIVVLNDTFWITVAIALAVFAVAAVAIVVHIKRCDRYWGPLRLYFSEEGLHLRDSVSESRTAWEEFLGYLEDGKVFLLYHNPKLYRIIPKRALAETSGSFEAFVSTKLLPYDYREPFASVNRKGVKPPVSPREGRLFS